MGLASRIKPISYLKANAAAVLKQLAETREPMVIAQNGEARAVIQDIASYERTQETLALLKLLAMAQKDLESGRTTPLDEIVTQLRNKYRSC
ncbi:type II toxin-antitoxin system Phd/YefM family antitoxin [Dyella flagellata]|uniref:Antitoxin n=1 Tax=Dyella flagellata TaxID=1867833 RepID=A0ABQ5XF86_9GAMM|nr:type II toxin-antitoxin system Phd/YefM family antitoxin [Dyella flagellata]GLQ90355.1 antitoxin [Dyella flagellata]